MTASMAIGDIARMAGLAPSAIRYYESIGLLPLPARANGRRRYEASVLNTLAVIRLGQQAGMRIEEIRTLLHGFPADTPPSARWQQFAGRKIEELNQRIAELEQMKAVLTSTLACACPTINDCGAALDA